MPKNLKDPKTEKPQRKQKKQGRNGFGYAFIQTKYGKRILIMQGEDKVWLREEDFYTILREIVSRAFKYNPPKTSSYD